MRTLAPPAEPKVSQQLSQILNTVDMNEKIVKSLLDLIILCKLREGPLYGYDLIKFVHRDFDTFLSPSTAYPVLYDLEKNGIIRSGWDGKKKMYTLAEPSIAETTIVTIVRMYMKVLMLADNKFAGKNDMGTKSL